MDVAAPIQGLLAKAAEWREPLLVASMDVVAALDDMRPVDVAASLRSRGCPAGLVAAWVRVRAGATVRIHLGPVATGPIALQKGCRQGAPATPFLWNHLLAGPLEGVESRWKERGPDMAWALALVGTTLLVWAENFFVLAGSWAELRARVAEVSRAIGLLGLRFSDSSLEVILRWRCSPAVTQVRGVLRNSHIAGKGFPKSRFCAFWASVLMRRDPRKACWTSAL